MGAIRYYNPELLHEVTQRVIGGQHVLDPNNAELRDAFVGVLAKSLQRYGVEVLAFHFMSNHYHGLFKIPSAGKFSRFLAYFHAGLAEAYHRVCNTDGKLWGYARWNPVANDEAAVCARLKYILGQATAAGLVAHPAEFPGASSIDVMLGRNALAGLVFDATRKCRDKRRKAGPAADGAYETRHQVAICPPDCWRGLAASELRERYAKLAEEVVADCGQSERQSQRLCQSTEITQQSPHPKRHILRRLNPDGTPYRQGRVHPKRATASWHRPFPDGRLLAADPSQVEAFARFYASVLAEYRRAKRAWRSCTLRRVGVCVACRCPIPPHTLLGTLPFPIEIARPPARSFGFRFGKLPGGMPAHDRQS